MVGWDASQNGNMAELLQEPSLMGALEGAAVTVLSKGMLFQPDPIRSEPVRRRQKVALSRPARSC